MLIDVTHHKDKMVIEEFFSNGDSNSYDLRLPYESEFIVRYLGEGVGCLNRIYINSKR